MVVAVVVYRHPINLGRVASLSDTCIVPSSAMKTSPLEGIFQIRSSSGPLGPASEVHVFNNRGPTINLWEATKVNRNDLCCFGKLLDSADQQFRVY